MTDYYQRLTGIGARARGRGLYRRRIADSVLGDEVFNFTEGQWQYTADLDLGLRHMSDDEFDPISREQARTRLVDLFPGTDPDEILNRQSHRA